SRSSTRWVKVAFSPTSSWSTCRPKGLFPAMCCTACTSPCQSSQPRTLGRQAEGLAGRLHRLLDVGLPVGRREKPGLPGRRSQIDPPGQHGVEETPEGLPVAG